MKNKMAVSRLPVVFLFAILVTSCGGGGSDSDSSSDTGFSTSGFTDWEQWSDPVDSSQFDIAACGPGAVDASSVQAGDLDGDGRLDLLCKLVASNGGTTPYVQLAGTGSFSAWSAWRNIAVEPGCEFDLVADFNGDGLEDWLCSILWQGRYETFYFRSDGSGFSGVGYLIGSVAASSLDLNRCRAFFVSDVNLDGRDDVICHYLYPDNSSATLRAMDDGMYSHHWDIVSSVAAPNQFRLDYCGVLDIGDVNGDGLLDQICLYEYASGQSSTWVQLAANDSFNDWQQWSELSRPGEFDLSQCHYFHSVDIDGDGLIDNLCMYQDGPDTGILVQTDSPVTTGFQYGHWESWFALSTDIIGCRDFDAAVPDVIEMSGDGMSDIICAYRNSTTSMTTWIQRSTGSNYGSWEAWTPALNFELDRCSALVAADVNGDHHTDLVCPYRFDDGSTATFVQRQI